MMKVKVLITKKNSDWYLNSDFLFYIISEKNLFIKYKKWWQFLTDSLTNKDVNFKEINII